LAACLFFVPAALPHASQTGQTQPKQAQPQSSGQTQTPEETNPNDEANPPEEDESVAPEKFVLNPLESERNIKVGNFYMHQGSRGYRAALARYERAAKYNPANAEAFFKIGEVEEKLKDPEKAKAAFERVVTIAPDSKLGREAKKKLASAS
jgi:tetratricopeptide (TPR) repeat protein